MHNYSFLSKKCLARKSEINGYGIFAIKPIAKLELIAAWGGMICSKKEIAKRKGKKGNHLDHPVSIYDDLFLVPFENQLESADHFNHSCKPNAGIKGQILLVARRNIEANEEICFDYETTEIGLYDGLPFNCTCGNKACRGKITGKAWKNNKFQRENLGYFSWYIEQKINLLKQK